PESTEVLRSSNLGAPVTLGSPNSAPARAYLEAVRKLQGQTVEVQKQRGLFSKLFARRAA
ncbi:MAG: septum site-determining protein MinD, partial [Pseudomonadota bacterium]|nr:septum site-determining protein MinD [Pseudomonadota bacterium]